MRKREVEKEALPVIIRGIDHRLLEGSTDVDRTVRRLERGGTVSKRLVGGRQCRLESRGGTPEQGQRVDVVGTHMTRGKTRRGAGRS